MFFNLYNLKNYSFLLICFTFITLLLACSKKADNDVEIREMIVGTWKTRLSAQGRFHIMEFANDGRYRELVYDGAKSTWNSADTIGIGSLNHILTWVITFDDSVYYEINHSKIIYNTENLNWPSSDFAPKEQKIKWIKPNTMKVNRYDRFHKYEKI